MHISIDTTEPLNDTDRRLLAALLDLAQDPPAQHRTAPDAQPAVAPAPQGFMDKVREGVSQFGVNPAAASDARLPVIRQAGVRTSSTRDDDAPTGVDPAPEPVQVPRESITRAAPVRVEDVIRSAATGLADTPAPVRHTSP